MEKINFVNGKQPAINATNLNKLQTNAENAIKEVTPKSIKMTISEDTAKGANVTLPVKYKVGSYCLDIFVNGEKLKPHTQVMFQLGDIIMLADMEFVVE